MAKRVLQPASLPKPANYSLGTEGSGKLVFVSGMVSVDSDGNTVAVGDIKGQARQVFNNIEKVLAEAGATRDHIMKITVFMSDLKNYAGFSEIRTEFFNGSYPASSAVEAKLIKSEWLVEIEAVALV
jgi:2-iminobutanoate/2-iminopropanoate deaminase